jgi:adenine-specific DNA-methyltransferase
VATTPEQRPAAPDRRSLGAVYTPAGVADWLAGRLVAALPEGATSVADFAVGEGALLAALGQQAEHRLSLFGGDVDGLALATAGEVVPEAELEELDAIGAALDGTLLGALGVEALDGAILNPPWGIDLDRSRAELQERFTLATGQFDSADLFVELTVDALEIGGAAAFLLPDSIFYPHRSPLRRFLLDNCAIDLIARLGEGFFPGVYRGLAALVVRRGRPEAGHKVDCLRLSPAGRRAALSGESSLAEWAAAGTHQVPQQRFAKSPGSAFSIDLREEDLRHVHAVERQGSGWTESLESGRGVELSKHGRIVECRRCHAARPAPRGDKTLDCLSCGGELDAKNSDLRAIVRPAGATVAEGWAPLIAGEDVRRYGCAPGREIELGVDGIKYKEPIGSDRLRLLFRKTGIGLKASLFTGAALTTQTVFHYGATEETPAFFLAYVQGVASSRAMQAFQMKRSGEFEWRSHPYVTQAVLAELPIKVPVEGSQPWRQAREIARLAERLTARGGDDEAIDLEIENLVAGLYGLTATDYEWVGRVLDEGRGMEGIAAMQVAGDRRITPTLVD